MHSFSNRKSENKNLNENFQWGKWKDILIYASISGALFVSTLFRSTTFYMMCLRSSQKFHNRVFDRLLTAPMSIFDNNPIGNEEKFL
jgi:ABC-type multidrug transport system fused ATPase/permease subunit